MKALELSADEREEIRTMYADRRSLTDIAEYIGCDVAQVRAVIQPARERPRTSGGLRDLLFDEIASLQRGDTEPQRAMAVSNLAKQIINVAKAELEFRQLAPDQKDRVTCLGSLQLGSESSPVTDAEETAPAS